MSNDDLRDDDRVETVTELAPETGNEDRDFVTSLARGLEVIRAFKPLQVEHDAQRGGGAHRDDPRRRAAVPAHPWCAKATPRPTASTSACGPRCSELGFSLLASMDITEIMQPVVDELAQRLQESVFRRGARRGQRALRRPRHLEPVWSASAINIGSRAPAHAVSTGRVLLAGLSEDKLHAYLDSAVLEKITQNTVTSKVQLESLIDETRRQGWCIVDQELEVGLPLDLGRRSRTAPARSSRRSNVLLPERTVHGQGDAGADPAGAARRRLAHLP